MVNSVKVKMVPKIYNAKRALRMECSFNWQRVAALCNAFKGIAYLSSALKSALFLYLANSKSNNALATSALSNETADLRLLNT